MNQNGGITGTSLQIVLVKFSSGTEIAAQQSGAGLIDDTVRIEDNVIARVRMQIT